MKKSLISLLTLLSLTLCLCSCGSIPKKIKEGTSLVIGRLEAEATYYPADGTGIDFNGIYHKSIQLKIINTETGKEVTIRPDKNGYFYLNNLNADQTYNLLWAQVTAESTSATRWVSFNITNWSFTPYEGTVINLGTIRFALDGQRNRVAWSSYEFDEVREHFESVAKDSEWISIDVYDYH